MGPTILAVLIGIQRLAELVHSARNERRLKQDGATEFGAAHYPLFVVLQSAWLVAIAAAPWLGGSLVWPWLAALIALQALRMWVILTLGRYWTVRIISLPDAPLVKTGPYRLIRHPNYLVVALEIPIGLLAAGLPVWAGLFGIANLALLGWRIRVEDRALAPRRDPVNAA